MLLASAGFARAQGGSTPVPAAAAPQPMPMPMPEMPQPAPEPTAAAEKPDTYFALPKYGGGMVDLADYAGKPVLIMFFQAGCPYCKKAAPFVQRLHEIYRKRGLNVVAISVQNSTGTAKDFVDRFKITFPVAISGSALAKKYRANGVPNFFLLDDTHTTVYQWRGYDPENQAAMINKIERILPAQK